MLPPDITKLVLSYATKHIYKFSGCVKKEYKEKLLHYVLWNPRAWYQILKLLDLSNPNCIIGVDPTNPEKLCPIIDDQIRTTNYLSMNPDSKVLAFLFAHPELISEIDLLSNDTTDPEFVEKIINYYDVIIQKNRYKQIKDTFRQLRFNKYKTSLGYKSLGIDISKFAWFRIINKYIDIIPVNYIGWVPDLNIHTKLTNEPDTFRLLDDMYWNDLSTNTTGLPLFIKYPHKINATNLVRNSNTKVVRIIKHLVNKTIQLVMEEINSDPESKCILEITQASGIIGSEVVYHSITMSDAGLEILRDIPDKISKKYASDAIWFPELYETRPEFFNWHNYCYGKTPGHIKIFESNADKLAFDEHNVIPGNRLCLMTVALSNEYLMSKKLNILPRVFKNLNL